MMKNKALLLLLLSLSGWATACACKLTVVNNTPFKATIYNRRDKTSTTLLSWQDGKIGDSDKRADITLSVFTLFGAKEKRFHLNQIACTKNPTHEITLYVNNVLNNRLSPENQSLFKVTKLIPSKNKKVSPKKISTQKINMPKGN